MSFSPFNWIRDALGIKHDLITAEKTQLEIQKLNDDRKLAQSLIRKDITLEEIKQYDSKLIKLMAEAAKNEMHTMTHISPQMDALTDIEFLELFLKFRKSR